MTAGNNKTVCRHTDCFAYDCGKCTALKGVLENCPFYQNKEKTRRERQKYFFQTIENERVDLIWKYKDTLTGLGLFDPDFRFISRLREELNVFQTETSKKIRAASYDDDTLRNCVRDLLPGYTRFGSAGVLSGEKDAAEQSEADEQEADPEQEPDEASDERNQQILDESGFVFKAAATDRDDLIKNIQVMASDCGNPDPEEMGRWQDTSVVERTEEKERTALLHIEPVRRTLFDKTYGMEAAGIVMQAMDDYVAAVRRQLESPDDIHNLLSIWLLENFIGSRWYWQLTNIHANVVRNRCLELALAQEKEKIITDCWVEITTDRR